MALTRKVAVSLTSLTGIVTALAAGAWFWFSRASAPRVASDHNTSQYVDGSTCAGCHAEIIKTWRQTGMGRSFYRPRADKMVEDFQTRNSFYHRPSDCYYEMIVRDGQYYQRRYQKDLNGSTTNVVEKRIDYVLGSGNHARSYLSRASDGRLIELPVSWYSEDGGYWAMSPGFDRRDNQDFRRTIRQDCMSCHNAYPPADSAASQLHGEPTFGDRLPEGIDCQRCHGPGSAHVAAASRAESDREAIRKAIVNPKRLTRDRQLEVCMQCHLETTSSRLPHTIRRVDRAPFAWAPDEPLANFALYFDHAPGSAHDDKFEIAHAAYRLRKSRCFQASEMTCTSCHNPHTAPRGSEAVAHYRTVCRSCHSAAHAKNPSQQNTSDCASCHMPKRRAEDAVHVVMTDHFIQRTAPPARELLAKRQEPDPSKPYRGEVVLYYPPTASDGRKDELYLALAQLLDGANLSGGIPRLKAAIERWNPAQPDFSYELGRAYEKAGDTDEAVRWLQDAAKRNPEFRPAQTRLGAVYLAAGRLAQASEILERSAGQDPAALVNLANAFTQQGFPDRARQALQRALEVDPESPEAHHLLAVIALKAGDPAAGEKALREAIRLQPELPEARHNLGKLLAQRREYREAEYHLAKAVAANPAYAEARYTLALVYLVLGAKEKALAEFQNTVRVDPKFAMAHNDLGDLYAAKGKLQDAIREYQLALATNPGLAETHLSLGVALARQGSVAEARVHLQKAAESTNPEAREAATRVLGSLRN